MGPPSPALAPPSTPHACSKGFDPRCLYFSPYPVLVLPVKTQTPPETKNQNAVQGHGVSR